MVRTLTRIYKEKNDATIIAKAVVKGWITTDEYKDITGETYSES